MERVKVPNDELIEKSVLGSMLISNESLVMVLGSLNIEDFYNIKNQVIFKAINNIYDRKIPVDVSMLFNELTNMQQIDNIGGLNYLDSICEMAVGLTSLEFYVKQLKDMNVARKLLIEMNESIKKYNKGIDGSISDFILEAGDRINKIVEQRRVSDFIKIDEYVHRVNKDFDIMKKNGNNSLTGISTGFAKLNNYTNGWQNENMIVLAARPSVGKTALALNFALTAAQKTKKTIAFFSLEMSGELITKRLLSMESEVNLTKINTGILSMDEKLRIDEASERLSKLNIYIDDTPSIKIGDIFTKSKKLQNNHNDLAFIVIDYIGLITSSKKSENRQLEVSEYSRKLKDLARTLHVPILVLCQLSRQVDSRENKNPILSDLRESGAIEQDADIVMLLSNQSDNKKVKNKNKDKEETENNVSNSITDKSIIKVDIAKNRNGQVGYTFLLFQKKNSKFYDITHDNMDKFMDLISNDKIEDIKSNIE